MKKKPGYTVLYFLCSRYHANYFYYFMFRLGAWPRETRKLENIGNSLGIMWQISKLPDIMRNEHLSSHQRSPSLKNQHVCNIMWKTSKRHIKHHRDITSQLPIVTYIKETSRKRSSLPEAEFLDEIQTKVLRVFLLAIYSQLHSFALRFLFLTQPLTVSIVRYCAL